MMTKFMNKQRGLLAAIMALVMVFAGAAFVAAEVDAANPANFNELKAGIVSGGTYDFSASSESEKTFTVVSDMITTTETVVIKGAIFNGSKFFFNGVADLTFDNCTFNNDETAATVYGSTILFKDCIMNGKKVTIQGDSTGNNITFNNSTGVYINTGNDITIGTSGCDFNVLGTTTISTIEVENSEISVNAAISVEKLDVEGTVAINGLGSLDAEEVMLHDGETSATIDITTDVTIQEGGSGITVTGDKFTPGDDFSGTYNDGNNLLISQDTKLDGSITVEKGKTLEIKGATITNVGENNFTITVKDGGYLLLEAADVRVPVIIEDGAEVSVTKPKKMTVTGDQTADLGVGFGNTLVLADLTVPSGKSIEAYGNVVIEGTVTVESDDGFHVYQGGNAQIDGALVIGGTANIDGKAVVNGSVKVYNEDGNASFNVGPKGDVTVLGTMDVLKGKTKNTTNTLSVAAGGDLNIEGTLTVTGTMSGMVCDMGTVVFNGETDKNAVTGFTVYDGVTLTIASVTGTLKITDDGIEGDDYYELNEQKQTVKKDGYYISTGNSITIANVKNVSVSVVLDETSAKDVNNESVRLVTSEMTVTGTIASIDEKTTTVVETVTINGASADTGEVNGKAVQGTAIIGDITLGKQVQLQIGNSATPAAADTVTEDIDVVGTVNVIAEDSLIVTNTCVDVTGTILVGEKTADAQEDLTVNGATYYIDDDAESDDKVTYYTTFENALAAVATAYDNEVTVLGEVEVATALEIPADATILFAEKAEMTIDVDGTITVAVGALFDASKAEKVDVDGMLVIMDKEYGLEGDNKLVYQVYTEAGEVATYSGLVLALRNATEGDVITVVKAGEIEKSVTIPEGVTLVVPNGSTLTIGSEKDDVTLTIAGTLKVEGTVDAAVTSKKVEIAVPGTIMEIGSGDIVFKDTTVIPAVDGIVMDDYVTFNTKVDGRATVVYSNLVYAAENATEGPVAIYGDVSAGDITFTMGEKAGEFVIRFGKADSTMTVGTMTLVSNGKAIIKIDATTNGTVTGTVASAAGSVDLNKVSGITITVSIVTDVDGSTDYMTVAGELDGKMSVATGTVTAGALLVGKSVEDVMTVATGATLLVPENKSVTVQTMNLVGTTVKQYYGLTVDGTLSVNKGAVTITGEVLVNGDVSIVDTNEVEIDDKLVVIGTITVSSTTEAKYALDVDGKLFIGSAPSIGATGTLVGNADLEGAIIAYPGSDLSGAIINDSNNDGVSDIEPTEFYINGQLYMTVYSVSVKDPVTFATGLDIQIPGLVNPQDKTPAEPIVWYIDENMKNVATGATIGSVDKLYTEFDAAEVDLVISAGVGLKVYIDGLDASEMDDITVGTHTVSFAVESGYDGSAATITVNGVQVSNNGTFIVDVDADKITIIASGAVPAQSGSTVVVDEDDGMALTDILLIVLVVLIVIMAIIVALRMMRS